MATGPCIQQPISACAPSLPRDRAQHFPPPWAERAASAWVAAAAACYTAAAAGGPAAAAACQPQQPTLFRGALALVVCPTRWPAPTAQIHDALKEEMGGIHALSIKAAWTPAQQQQQQQQQPATETA